MECQQPGILHGRKPECFSGHVHAWLQCLVPSKGRSRAMGLQDEARGRVGVSASVGRWHRRVLPRENPHRKRGSVFPSAQSSAWDSQGLCSCLRMGWGSHRGEEMLCSCQWCFPPGHALSIFPCLSSLRATLQPSCIPQGLLMCKPLLGERL